MYLNMDYIVGIIFLQFLWLVSVLDLTTSCLVYLMLNASYLDAAVNSIY